MYTLLSGLYARWTHVRAGASVAFKIWFVIREAGAPIWSFVNWSGRCWENHVSGAGQGRMRCQAQPSSRGSSRHASVREFVIH